MTRMEKSAAKKSKKDLEQVQRTRDGKIDKSDIKLTHMMDACSYYISYKYPVVKREAVSYEW